MGKIPSIYIAGHRGMVGAAVVRKLEEEGSHSIIVRTRQELDLTDQQATNSFFAEQTPDTVVFAAAKVARFFARWRGFVLPAH